VAGNEYVSKISLLVDGGWEQELLRPLGNSLPEFSPHDLSPWKPQVAGLFYMVTTLLKWVSLEKLA
jgi:hypothetical protein